MVTLSAPEAGRRIGHRQWKRPGTVGFPQESTGRNRHLNHRGNTGGTAAQQQRNDRRPGTVVPDLLSFE
jgi:hypothetical protein